MSMGVGVLEGRKVVQISMEFHSALSDEHTFVTLLATKVLQVYQRVDD